MTDCVIIAEWPLIKPEETWINLYDGGSAADGPVRRQYYISFWWSITTLFAVNPIPQRTDSERDFMIMVNVFNRLFFAYIVGNISSIIAQFDRQAAMVHDKIDLLKEYLQWRAIPKVGSTARALVAPWPSLCCPFP